MVEEQEREFLRESDLARKICMGEGKQFKNERCPNFDVLTKECKLLRDNPLEVLYKKERCLPEWEFQWRAHKILKKNYPRSLQREDVDLKEFVFGRHDDERDHKAMLDYRVDVPTISRMYGLINLSLKREIERILRQKRLVPPKKKCGTCVHRGPVKPHACQLESFPSKTDGNPFPNKHFGTERKADDAPCDGYVAMVNQLNSFLDEESPIEGGLMGSDSALWLGARTWKEQLEQIHAILDVPVMFKAIRRCAANARPRSKACEIFERWYEENDFIYEYLKKHRGSYERAKSHFLDERIGDHEKKRKAYSKKMERDADDLGKCLSGKERCQELSAPGGEWK
jgi:hypothetical protein